MSFLDYVISEMQSTDLALAGAIENFRGTTQRPGSEANIGESGSSCSHTVPLVVLQFVLSNEGRCRFVCQGAVSFSYTNRTRLFCRKVFLQVNIAYKMDAALLMNMFIGTILNV